MHRSFAWCALGACLAAAPAAAQDQAPQQHQDMAMPANHGWMLMQDGILFAEYNHQGGPRGGDQFVSTNWWMGTASRDIPTGRLAFTAMLSLEPATVGTSGYREILQAGEALAGRPLIDRQHPHDLFMQLAAVWRTPVTASTELTLAGGPVGEPALGPIAFMHRASAADNPTAPLSHHTLDSTHVAFGVVTAAVDHGPWTVEGSVFNGREPDEHRWDFDFGRLDSFSGRVWYRPNREWELQASTGRLVAPEQLEPGNIVRSTASAAWTRSNGAELSAVTVAYGRNDTERGAQNALLLEGTRRAGMNTVYGRFEALQVETALLQTDTVVEGPAAGLRSKVLALTVGGVRDLRPWRGFEAGVGADVTLYRPAAELRPTYSARPLSFHLFFVLRPPAGPMGRMWNMRMTEAGRM